MVVDPIDDCTFWYTNEYVVGGNWRMRIGAFKFPTCTTANPDRDGHVYGHTLTNSDSNVNGNFHTNPAVYTELFEHDLDRQYGRTRHDTGDGQ
jgi:hypothetical protein